MEPEAEPGGWKQKGLVLIGAIVVVVSAAGVGLYTFFTAMATPLHPNPADVPSVSQATPSLEWAGAVDRGRQLARAGLVEQNLPGLSVAVGVAGDLVWAEGFGWADLENRVPVAPHLRFRIGHASKALTSAAVGLLLENGRLDLDEEIQTYVPAFPRKQWTVTLRHLMGHVAGVRHYDNEADYMPSAHCERASEGLPRVSEPFFSFMRSQVFQPLGMRDTTTDSVTPRIPDLATFYDPRLSGDPQYGPEPSATVDYSCFAGAGAFLSTPSDLVRFGMAVNSGNLLKPATVSMLQTPQRLLSGDTTDYGLGWMLETVPLAGEPTRVAGHASRTMLGSSTSFMTLPERGIVVAVMSNTSDAFLRSISLGLLQAFAEQQRSPAGK